MTPESESIIPESIEQSSFQTDKFKSLPGKMYKLWTLKIYVLASHVYTKKAHMDFCCSEAGVRWMSKKFQMDFQTTVFPSLQLSAVSLLMWWE